MTVTMEQVRRRAEADARMHGYYLSPDPEFLDALLKGLKENEDRYGYPSCPCRLATGVYEQDRDIICPCDYRDPDVAEYGSCYCCLYVDKRTFDSREIKPIPERRPVEKMFPSTAPEPLQTLTEPSRPSGMKLWYCRQCGYVAFREEPPYLCPICRAKREFFAEIRPETLQGMGLPSRGP